MNAESKTVQDYQKSSLWTASLVTDELFYLFEDYGAGQLCFLNLRNLLSVFYDQYHLLGLIHYFEILDDILVGQYFIDDDCLECGHFVLIM